MLGATLYLIYLIATLTLSPSCQAGNVPQLPQELQDSIVKEFLAAALETGGDFVQQFQVISRVSSVYRQTAFRYLKGLSPEPSKQVFQAIMDSYERLCDGDGGDLEMMGKIVMARLSPLSVAEVAAWLVSHSDDEESAGLGGSTTKCNKIDFIKSLLSSTGGLTQLTTSALFTVFIAEQDSFLCGLEGQLTAMYSRNSNSHLVDLENTDISLLVSEYADDNADNETVWDMAKGVYCLATRDGQLTFLVTRSSYESNRRDIQRFFGIIHSHCKD